MTLTNLQTLYLRACKCKDPNKRFLSLYKRFYTRSGYEDYNVKYAAILNLSQVVEPHKPLSVSEPTLKLQPVPSYTNITTTPDSILYVLIREIRYTKMSRFYALRQPLKVKKEYNMPSIPTTNNQEVQL